MNQPTNHIETPTSSNWSLVALSPVLGDLSIAVDTRLRIGRNDNNDVVLASPQISRQHAIIEASNQGLYVQDLGSANGTFINGARIGSDRVSLQSADELAFADLVFIVDETPNLTEGTESVLADRINAIELANTVDTVMPTSATINVQTTSQIDDVDSTARLDEVLTVQATNPTTITDGLITRDKLDNIQHHHQDATTINNSITQAPPDVATIHPISASSSHQTAQSAKKFPIMIIVVILLLIIAGIVASVTL